MPAPAQEQDIRRLAFPRRIAVATDLDDQDSLLSDAIAQARALGAHLTLIHAFQEGDRTREVKARERLEKMHHAAYRKGVCCSIRMSCGDTIKVILDSLLLSNTDRLIAGTHARRHLRELVLGSVARELMAAVKIPTVFVGPEVSTEPTTRNILCLVSMEGGYEKLARFALLLGEVHKAHVTLMHVFSEDTTATVNQARSDEWAHKALQSLADGFGRRQDQTAISVKHGSIVAAVSRAVKDLRIDALIVGTREPADASPLKDGLAYQILASSSCPVYCYRVDDAGPATSPVHDHTYAVHR